MHASVAVVIAVSAFIQFRENRWGGIGGELGGTKVSWSVLPNPDAERKGCHRE